MSELYHHLLIPRDPGFVPDLDSIARLYVDLVTLGALPDEVKFNVVTHTGNTRPYARNPKTGEEYCGPELNIRRKQGLQSAIDALRGVSLFDLSAEAVGPTAIPPFHLYSADNYVDRRLGEIWKQSYTFSVRCKLRPNVTHFLHSTFGCKCEIKLDEPGVFANPWDGKVIKTSGRAYARFWIDIGIGNWLMPMVNESTDILDARLVSKVNEVFGVEFTQGCFRSDD